jgi:hypothetical protein
MIYAIEMGLFFLFIFPLFSISLQQAGASIPLGPPTVSTQIDGIGFGNSGNRFSAFVECSNGKHISFDGGSMLTFSAILSINKQQEKQHEPSTNNIGLNDKHNAIGTWQIEYRTTLNDQLLYQEGIITSMDFEEKSYLLYGTETHDDVCGTINERIVIEAWCLDNIPIKYLNFAGDKSGSTAPPDYLKVYRFFSSKVSCV